ncbi:maltose operon protein MalM [Erwinia rhapontici]|uniref:Maltose operon protein MalM n=1 Tax=Erwinia rhapontici TaxID=55212 RepID=A0ABN6DER6_ERWRD|nr:MULTISPECIES: maltose operon protein MalM [Erwinia]NKG29188.1 maltose operon protein MalM [Erwinia rhapontici]NNS06910.1 maltose operon protein MalM [Erwinia sp. JH02]UDQ80848.1 maltose operon protein MalM [Erwinia rhapontici]BCQ33259.1 maltose operon protein MalM [Erwinia rhapontici]BCQ43138.1 maltose operon protein MalM [Erwinia rhapontici]
MRKNLLSLCLSLSLLAALPAGVYAAQQDASTAPAIASQTLHTLSWTPLVPPVTQDVTLGTASATINQGDIQGAVAAFALPADRGSLEITLSSIATGKTVYAPNVLVLDEQMRPAAFYPSSYFPYQQPGIVSSDRLEGTLKLTPALGQKQIYLLVYTTRQDLAETTQMVNPAKAYAAGVGNAVPDIPDPIARHTTTGLLSLKVSAEQKSGNVMIGQVFPSSAPAAAPVMVGRTAPAAAPAVTKPDAPMLDDSERYFNDAISKAVKAGDVDKALKLLDEAERLGSKTARKTFIDSVKR